MIAVPFGTYGQAELAKAPLNGWIGVVHQGAKDRIERSWKALEWYDRVIAAEDEVEFFSAWRLFVRAADKRAIEVEKRRPHEAFLSLPQRRRDFLSFAWSKMAKGTEREKQMLESTLYTFRKGFMWAMPWGQ